VRSLRSSGFDLRSSLNPKRDIIKKTIHMTADTFPKNQVVQFDQSVEYAENSIVSKAVIKSDPGNITLFAFDRGQELSEHTAPFDALVQVLDGRVEIKIAGEGHTLEKGAGIIMPANIPHSVKAVQRFKMLLTMIKK
jgi:quercetin dioxygenase-like cupin family protein